MEIGFYSFRDYDQKLHYIYVLDSNESNLFYIYAELYVWLEENGISHLVNQLKPHSLTIHLPYLTKLTSINKENLLPPYLSDISLKEEDVPEAIHMYDFLNRFENWYHRISVEERFRLLTPQFETHISNRNMRNIIHYLFNKYVNDENRFRLYLHCGIQRYLTNTKERNK